MYETSISISSYINLRKFLNLNINDIGIFDIIQQLPIIEDDLLKLLGADVKGVYCEHSSKWKLNINEENGYNTFMDEWGVRWFMPKKKGFYYDARFHPLHELTFEEIKRYQFPDFTDKAKYKNLRKKALKIRDEKYALVSGAGAGILYQCQLLRGTEKYFIDMAADKRLAEYLLDRVTESICTAWEFLLKEIGDLIDIAYTGDDLASQDSTFISLDMYRNILKPRQKKIISTIKKYTDAKILYHSCGSIYSFIPELIDIGVDILNPIQVSAKNMDTKKLKIEFGRDIVFWGGGCDTQHILPYGTIEEAELEVKKRIEDLAIDGGFVFNQVHNIQAQVPPENIMAMYNTLKKNWWY